MNHRSYIGTKIVLACCIAAITSHPTNEGRTLIHHDTEGLTPLDVADEWVAAKKPEVGGYVVFYPDGYMSYSPAKPFEEAYRPTDGMTFGLALEALKKGQRITRKGWNGKGMFLFLLPAGRVPKSAIHDPALRAVIDEQIEGDSFEALPSIRMWTTNSAGRRAVLTGWLASQTDMLSDDWQIVA